MQKKFFQFIAILLVMLGIVTHSLAQEGCPPKENPLPVFGAHPTLVFSNVWNMLNSGYGELWGSANMGNAPIPWDKR
jgi:hypothetical protein